jgi:hypothetical protein
MHVGRLKYICFKKSLSAAISPNGSYIISVSDAIVPDESAAISVSAAISPNGSDVIYVSTVIYPAAGMKYFSTPC